MHMACCDEEGTNCVDGQPIPQTCPVGCAVVFPDFLEVCRDHLEQDGMDVHEFDAFEQGCLEADGLEVVEYALDLQRKGCTLTGLDTEPPAGTCMEAADGEVEPPASCTPVGPASRLRFSSAHHFLKC
jgi:hypothetical protein